MVAGGADTDVDAVVPADMSSAVIAGSGCRWRNCPTVIPDQQSCRGGQAEPPAGTVYAGERGPGARWKTENVGWSHWFNRSSKSSHDPRALSGEPVDRKRPGQSGLVHLGQAVQKGSKLRRTVHARVAPVQMGAHRRRWRIRARWHQQLEELVVCEVTGSESLSKS